MASGPFIWRVLKNTFSAVFLLLYTLIVLSLETIEISITVWAYKKTNNTYNSVVVVVVAVVVVLLIVWAHEEGKKREREIKKKASGKRNSIFLSFLLRATSPCV